MHDVPLFREFSGLDNWTTRLSGERTVPRFCHLLEKHKLAAQTLLVVSGLLRAKGLLLKAGTVADAGLIAAPARPRTPAGNVSSRCTRARRAIRSTLA
ncbi:MAG: hypothetical protein H7242_08295 [Microbacteriaceae bacterium]|nr:hypothetical protein [Burkholderiaceae bacterium]